MAPLLEVAGVAAVRVRLAHPGIGVLDFGVDPRDGQGWAMLLATDDPEAVGLLAAVGWEAWEKAWRDDCSRTQLETAHAELARSGLRPDHSAN